MSRRLPDVPPFAAALRPASGQVGTEVAAGVTLAALCLPLNIGYAQAAGLPAQVGIYATIVPLLLYGLTAGSRRLRIGPDATIAALMAATVGPLATRTGADPTALATATALLVGSFLIGFWVLRLGSVVRYLSKSVLIGFIAGLALEVLLSQVAKILAVETESEGWFLEAWELLGSLPEASLPSVIVGVGTIAALRLLRRVAPRLPAALGVLTVVTAIVAVAEPAGVAVLGDVPSGLPRPALPGVTASAWFELAGTALAIAVLTIAEGLLLAKRAARGHGEALEPNAELFPLGIANVAGALTGAMPSGASASRTAAIEATGARSQLPAIVAALVVIAVVLWFTDLVAMLPAAALAGLVANAVVSTIEVAELRRLFRLRRVELGIAVGCALGVLLLGPMRGLVLAAIASSVDVVRRAEAAPWTRLGPPRSDQRLGRFAAVTDRKPTDGLVVVRPGGPLFFATADELADVLADAATEPGLEWLVLDLEVVFDIDPTAADALLEGVEAVHGAGRVLALSRANQQIRGLLDRYGITAAVGPERLFETNRAAEAAFHADLQG